MNTETTLLQPIEAPQITAAAIIVNSNGTGDHVQEPRISRAPSPLPVRRIYFGDTETGRKAALSERLFPLILLITISLGIAVGIVSRNVPPLQRSITSAVRSIKSEFHFTEPQKSVSDPVPVVEKKIPAKKVSEPVDLTKISPQQKNVEEAVEPPAPEKRQVRKVFGLRRVYSTGLGSGGSITDGVVAKIGNTINKEYDTVTATESDIKGTVVSAVSITSAPRFRKVVKPIYTKEMIAQKVEGTIKVKVLVDIDGRVKKATCLNDIGFGSTAEAMKATLQMEFDPGMRDTEPVAVWIIVPITFALLG